MPLFIFTRTKTRCGEFDELFDRVILCFHKEEEGARGLQQRSELQWHAYRIRRHSCGQEQTGKITREESSLLHRMDGRMLGCHSAGLPLKTIVIWFLDKLAFSFLTLQSRSVTCTT